MTPTLFMDALTKALAALIVIALLVGLLYLPAQPVRFTPIIDVAAPARAVVEMMRR